MFLQKLNGEKVERERKLREGRGEEILLSLQHYAYESHEICSLRNNKKDLNA